MDLTSEGAAPTGAAADIDFLLSPKAIRARAKQIFERTVGGEGLFVYHADRLDSVAEYVCNVIRERHPSLEIPYHSRWAHFKVGGRNRLEELERQIDVLQKDPKSPKNLQTPEERARIMVDLVIVSVLLDAGSGPQWKYRDVDGHFYSRSEGLGVASFNMFMDGKFSSDRVVKLRSDGPALIHITEEIIKDGFQVSVSNPLLGTKGRAELLHRVGKTIEATEDYFDSPDRKLKTQLKRPGNLVNYFFRERPSKKIEASFILQTLLRALGPIWPGRIVMNDVNLGDTWVHDGLGEGIDSFVPFHKLSQWLTYSLLEPLEACGFTITGLNELTGLAEYRNGGLLLDSGLITPKDPTAFDRPVHADSKLVIEWRALTVYLLDEIAKRVQQNLGLSPEKFPLVKVLEGGTWWAGRKIAQEKRPGGGPPIQLVSDGTVF